MSCNNIEPTGTQAERVLAIRLAHGLSQAELASLLRLGQTTVSRMERGESEVSGPTDFLLDLMEGPHSDLLFNEQLAAMGKTSPRPRARQRAVGSRPACPVQDIAETVQLLVEALYKAEDEKSADHDAADHEALRKVTQAEHRYDALWDLLGYKKEQAACTQALSAGGAAHQIAIASELIDRMRECAPEEALNREDYYRAKECHRLLQWTLYSVLNVLLSLEPTPREKLGIEYYMAAEHSPFVRTAVEREAA